jgi:hypothetical protein
MINSKFQYQLAKRGKSICPACGKRTFVLYVSNETGEPLNSKVGRCDRLDHCAHHYTPKQYFSDNGFHKISAPFHVSNPLVFGNGKRFELPKSGQVSAPSYHDKSLIMQTLKHYYANGLYTFLKGVVGNEVLTRQAFDLYKVGTSKDGRAVFWQVDTRGHVRAGKLIAYRDNGHRAHDIKVDWVHNIMKMRDFNLKQCFFGEHLLSDSTKTVCVVESEKTAIVASIYKPNRIWIASGGLEGLNAEKCEVLRGRNVVMYPDLAAKTAGKETPFEKWTRKADELKHICRAVVVSDTLERIATEQEREAGLDLADFLLRQPTRSQQPAQVEAQPANQSRARVHNNNDSETEPKSPEMRPKDEAQATEQKAALVPDYQQEAVNALTNAFPSADEALLTRFVETFDLGLDSIQRPEQPPTEPDGTKPADPFGKIQPRMTEAEKSERFGALFEQDAGE